MGEAASENMKADLDLEEVGLGLSTLCNLPVHELQGVGQIVEKFYSLSREILCFLTIQKTNQQKESLSELMTGLNNSQSWNC